MSEPMCDVRNARRSAGGMCGGSGMIPAVTSREAADFSWQYDWHGGDLVRARFDGGMEFQFERRMGGITENNVAVLIQGFRDRVQDERERDIRGNPALRWLANLWSGDPPNRSQQFRQMELAASRATAAASRRDLRGVFREIQRGLTYLRAARGLYRDYYHRHVAGAERNVQIVELTRDISLTVAPAVLTGGASLSTQVAVGVAIAGGTTAIEEIGVSRFGQDATIDWGRIALDSTIGVVAGLCGPLLGDFSAAITKRLGVMARSSRLSGPLVRALERRFPPIGPQLREAILREGGEVRLSALGADGETLRVLVATVVADTITRAPEQLMQRLVETTMRNLLARNTQQSISMEEFWEKLVDGIAKDGLSRTIVSAIVASLAS